MHLVPCAPPVSPDASVVTHIGAGAWAGFPSLPPPCCRRAQGLSRPTPSRPRPSEHAVGPGASQARPQRPPRLLQALVAVYTRDLARRSPIRPAAPAQPVDPPIRPISPRALPCERPLIALYIDGAPHPLLPRCPSRHVRLARAVGTRDPPPLRRELPGARARHRLFPRGGRFSRVLTCLVKRRVNAV